MLHDAFSSTVIFVLHLPVLYKHHLLTDICEALMFQKLNVLFTEFNLQVLILFC